MSWRSGNLAVLMLWLFLASPAAAGVQSHTDSQGVLHIGNTAPSQPDNPSAVPETMPAPPEMSAPTEPQPSQPKNEETSAAEADLNTIQKVCQGLARGETPALELDGIIAAAGQAAAGKEAAEVAVDYNFLPVRKVSSDHGAAPALAPQPAAPKPAEVAGAGGIRRFRDHQGVLHISNAAPGAEAMPAVQMAQSPRNQGGEARQSGQSEEPQPRLPIQRAAWSPDDHLATLPTKSSPAGKTAPEGSSPIRRYRDSQGVIHISNVDPEPREALPTPAQIARSRSVEEFEPQGGLAIRPAAWNGEGGIKLLKRVKATTPPKTAEVTTEGGIRRYRDKKGTIHIKTVEYPLPPGVVLPPRQANSSLLAPMTVAPTVPASPSAAAASNLPAPATSAPSANPTTFSGAGAQITAYKDAKGRLRITTQMPQLAPDKALAPLPVYAELEPIILEAAQIHRLPPTLIKAVIKVESNFCSWAVSPKGAMGLMQLMPGTADLLGVREPFNPRENILGGCRYLRDLINLFGGNLPLALASYNAGFQRVVSCGYQIPAIKETQEFVTAVMGHYVAEEKRGPQPWT